MRSTGRLPVLIRWYRAVRGAERRSMPLCVVFVQELADPAMQLRRQAPGQDLPGIEVKRGAMLPADSDVGTLVLLEVVEPQRGSAPPAAGCIGPDRMRDCPDPLPG